MQRVLIVDDSSTFRSLLAEAVENMGHTVVGEAEDGCEALAKFKELKPDVTFMDITMPQMNGIEALKGLLGHDPDAKVVMFSSVAVHDNITEALILGAYDFLRKPLEQDKLEALMSGIEDMAG